jgi:ankyrin repeat protein
VEDLLAEADVEVQRDRILRGEPEEDESGEHGVEHSDDDGDSSAANTGDPQKNAELIIACYKGEGRRVDQILGDGANYFARGGHTPLPLPLTHLPLPLTHLPLPLTHLPLPDRHGWTGLMWAAANGFDDIIDILLDHVGDRKKFRSFINAKDHISGLGWTALHIACVKGQVKSIRKLVKEGANVDVENSMKETPLDCLNCKNDDDRMELRHFLNDKSTKRKS